MKGSAGVVAGFAAGVAIAVVAIVWLRVQENVTRERDAARVAELEAQVRRLEQTVARLSDQVLSNRQIFTALPGALAAMQARADLGPEPGKTRRTDPAIVTAAQE